MPAFDVERVPLAAVDRVGVVRRRRRRRAARGAIDSIMCGSMPVVDELRGIVADDARPVGWRERALERRARVQGILREELHGTPPMSGRRRATDRACADGERAERGGRRVGAVGERRCEERVRTVVLRRRVLRRVVDFVVAIRDDAATRGRRRSAGCSLRVEPVARAHRVRVANVQPVGCGVRERSLRRRVPTFLRTRRRAARARVAVRVCAESASSRRACLASRKCARRAVRIVRVRSSRCSDRGLSHSVVPRGPRRAGPPGKAFVRTVQP